MKAWQILEKHIDELKKDNKNMSISIIGSAANTKKEHYDNLRDLDLFIVRDSREDFQREVINIDSISIDTTYISIYDLNKLIAKDNHRWIRILSKAKHIYKSNRIIEGYFELANNIFISGPDLIDTKDIDFYRFRLTNQFEDILRRKDNEVDTHFLINIFINDILKLYYKMQNTWIPRDKKMLSTLFSADPILYELVKAALVESDLKERITLTEDILIYVLKPYGGTVTKLERCNVPFNSGK